MTTLALTAAAYLLGSIPFGVLLGYLALRRDIREGGSGHSGGTNAIRQAGWRVGLPVIALDMAKGAMAVWPAFAFGDELWAPALAAGAVVAGHCWPVFAGFRGGMGLATAGGVMAVAYPLGFAAALGVLLAAAFMLKHSARAAFATGMFGPPVIWGLSASLQATAIAAALGFVIAIRALSDWGHKRRAVWDVRKTED
ncbi:MAG: glycerol-3-phosphate acyltransferase [Anaerolineales bacterium]|nr:glycerol-3-phosphate acyltransferase [Anaerolineales bacterium]